VRDLTSIVLISASENSTETVPAPQESLGAKPTASFRNKVCFEKVIAFGWWLFSFLQLKNKSKENRPGISPTGFFILYYASTALAGFFSRANHWIPNRMINAIAPIVSDRPSG